MFLNLGHQLAKRETCGDGRRGNARYMSANKTEVDHQLISPDDLRLISLYMGSPLSRIYATIYDHVFPRFPRPAKEAQTQTSQSIVCAGAMLKGSTCLLWHITSKNRFCVNTRYALLKTLHKKYQAVSIE